MATIKFNKDINALWRGVPFNGVAGTVFNFPDHLVPYAVAELTNPNGLVATIVSGQAANSPTLGQLTPADLGLIAQNFDLAAAQGTRTVGTSGTIEFSLIDLPATALLTGVAINVSVVAASVTAGQTFAGIYDATPAAVSGGALLATSATLDTAFTATGLVKIPFTTALANDPGGLRAIAVFTNAATKPQFAAIVPPTAVDLHGTRTAGKGTFGTADTGRTTSLPATLGAITNGATHTGVIWVGVY